MANRRGPDKVTEARVAGVYVRFEYHYPKRNVVVLPDEDELRAADVYAVCRVWVAVANWGARFVAANPGWTINGADPVETLGEDLI